MKSACLRMQGFSLIETLVVLAVFSSLALLSTSAVLLTLRGVKRSESTVKVRQNLNYAMSIIERQLHNASGVVCPNSDELELNYSDENGQDASFACSTDSQGGFVASASARLTNQDVNVTSCSFACVESSGSNPSSVTVNLVAGDISAQGAEGATVTTSDTIFLRNY
jgi:prepilin-type N-terminal cleavage/methylation domain-containing protein